MLYRCAGQRAHHAEGTEHEVLIEHGTQNGEKPLIGKQPLVVERWLQINGDHQPLTAHRQRVIMLTAVQVASVHIAKGAFRLANQRSVHNLLEDHCPVDMNAPRRVIDRLATERFQTTFCVRRCDPGNLEPYLREPVHWKCHDDSGSSTQMRSDRRSCAPPTVTLSPGAIWIG